MEDLKEMTMGELIVRFRTISDSIQNKNWERAHLKKMLNGKSEYYSLHMDTLKNHVPEDLAKDILKQYYKRLTEEVLEYKKQLCAVAGEIAKREEEAISEEIVY